jgi:tetratricopeptide (TPR) repeat protein
MKSERRHELQQNELDQELHELLRWFRRNASRVIWGAILVIGVAVAVILWFHNQRQAAAALQENFSQAMVFPNPQASPDEQLRKLNALTEADDGRIAAAAILRIGNIHLMRASSSTMAMQAVKDGEDAVLHFNRVIKDYARFPKLVGGAYYGLGKEAEGREDWSQAREYYEKVANMPQLRGHPVALFAEGAIARLASLKEPVYLSDMQPVSALPMGPIKAVQAFLQAAEKQQADKLGEMVTEGVDAAEMARMVRDLPGEAPGVLTSDVADTSAFVLTNAVRGEDDSLKPLVIKLVKKGENWLVSSMELKTAEQARVDQAVFRKEFPTAQTDIEPMTDLNLDADLPEPDANAVEPIEPIEPIESLESDANTTE